MFKSDQYIRCALPVTDPKLFERVNKAGVNSEEQTRKWSKPVTPPGWNCHRLIQWFRYRKLRPLVLSGPSQPIDCMLSGIINFSPVCLMCINSYWGNLETVAQSLMFSSMKI